jgi:hypothetical protein
MRSKLAMINRRRKIPDQSPCGLLAPYRLPQSLTHLGLGEEVWAELPEVNRLLAVRWLAVLAGRALPEAAAAAVGER